MTLLGGWAAAENVTARRLALYLFEVMSDCHLSPEQMAASKDSFMAVFAGSLVDKEVSVRVAGLKATISFLTSLDDSDVVASCAGVAP